MSEKRSVAPPQLHFDDGSRIMTASEGVGQQKHSSKNPRGTVSIHVYYEIYRLSNEIKQLCNSSQEECRVALQFPDELLCDAPEVCWAMEQALPEALVFVLGDTTFGPCCPDEVSALHLDATVLVHYGHACLSPAASLPVLYGFGVSESNVAQTCVDAVMKQQQGCAIRTENILLLYEVRYHHAIRELEKELRERGGFNVTVGQIPEIGPSTRPSPSTTADEDITSEETETTATVLDPEEASSDKFVVGGLELPANIDWSTYTLLFIGGADSTSRQYVNIMLRFLSMSTGSPSQYWTFYPSSGTLETTLPPFLQRQLNRRFYLTQKARDASVYGILVGTLSQLHFQSVVKTLQQVIHDAGKSCYTFAVGKINGAKLANFGEIECFVLVACGENSLLDNERDLHVPVITPLELDIALGNTDWGPYSLDYNDFLSQQARRTANTTTTDNDNDDAPYFSLISGQYVDSKKPTEAIDLSVLPGKGQLAAYKSEASNYLRNREYQGLEANIGKDEAHAALEGQTGIASDYGNR